MATCVFQNSSKSKDQLRIVNQLLKGLRPFSYYLLCKETEKLWDFFYVKESGEIGCHRIQCYKFGKLKIYKNAGPFCSETLEGLMAHLIGRSLASCFQIGLCL